MVHHCNILADISNLSHIQRLQWVSFLCRVKEADRVLSVYDFLRTNNFVLHRKRVLNDFYKFRLKPIAVPPPGLISDFRRLINNPELADVQFRVEGREVYAHKAILTIRSDYFRVMLCGGMRESGTLLSPEAPIELPNVSFLVFCKVLEFLYTDTVRDVSLETGIHLLIASEQFMLDRLKALCEDFIRRDINVENVITILVASHRHNASGLKDIALEFILRHLNDPTIMSGLSELKAEPDLLLEIIRSPVFVAMQEFNFASTVTVGTGAEWDARR